MSGQSVKSFVSAFMVADTNEERETCVEKAMNGLSPADFVIFTTATEKLKTLDPSAGGQAGSPVTPTSKKKGKGKAKKVVVEEEEESQEESEEEEVKPKKKAKASGSGDVSDADLARIWTMVDEIDLDGLITPEIIKDFQYSGFNPDAILKSLIKKKKEKGVSNTQFMADISTLVLIAIMKGSVTDGNLKKLSDGGKRRYSSLEETYGLKRNGAKGKSGDVVTISRIAATFPGVVVKTISEYPDTARAFSGSFKTDKLPSFMRHQAMAACIPKSLDDKTKEFILSLIIAFSVDQTKSISKTKESYGDLFSKQKNFTMVSHNGAYPPDKVRKEIFSNLEWKNGYPKMKEVFDIVKKTVTDLESVDVDHFTSTIGEVK